MKVVIAPDSFKESLSAERVAGAIASGFGSVFPDIEIDRVPVADGGEGTTEALVAATGGALFLERVSDPLGRRVEAHWGMLGDTAGRVKTAVIETASASGLERLTVGERNPLLASTAGTGELILKALDSGARRIILGLGGSATNDAGLGLLQTLGIQFLNSADKPLPEGGSALIDLVKISLDRVDPRLKDTEFLVACDVDNPLLGKRGATAVFGPQKGATPELVTQLDKCLAHFADISESLTGRSDRDIPGAGAAGGLGFALVQYLGARLAPGIDLVLEAVQFDKRLAGASLVITGEGRIDGQSLGGKTPIGVARWAKRQNLPVIALCGSIGEGVTEVHKHGIDSLFSVVPGVCDLESALEDAESNIERCAGEIARVLKLANWH